VLLREASLASMRESLGFTNAICAQPVSLEAVLDMLLGALDAYTGSDPASLLFVEAYLASLRDPRLAQDLAALAALVVGFRHRFCQWLAAHGQAAPVATAAVLAAALYGVLLHRALGSDLTSAAVRQVPGRVLVRVEPAPTSRSRKDAERNAKP
jgi:hypothetical protein